jgi:hypothetical protein
LNCGSHNKIKKRKQNQTNMFVWNTVSRLRRTGSIFQSQKRVQTNAYFFRRKISTNNRFNFWCFSSVEGSVYLNIGKGGNRWGQANRKIFVAVRSGLLVCGFFLFVVGLGTVV